MLVPGGDDLLDGEAYPDLPEDLEEDEWAEAGERDLCFWVLGLGAEPAPLHPVGGVAGAPK